MITNKDTKTTLAARVRNLIAGTQKHPPTGTLTIDGEAYTQASIVQTFQSLADAIAATDAAKAEWQTALQNLNATRTAVRPVLSAYQSWIRATYGNAPATLADYGLAPKKARTPLSTDQSVVAIQKRNATRAARHTMGSKQKVP